MDARDGNVPLVLVPASHPTLMQADIAATRKVGIITYGNHATRAAVAGMRLVFEQIFRDGGIAKVDQNLPAVIEIMEFQGSSYMRDLERRYMLGDAVRCESASIDRVCPARPNFQYLRQVVKKCRDELRIEVATTFIAHQLQCFIDRPCVFRWPFAGQSIEHVSHGKQMSDKRNRLASQSIRIVRPLPSLMVTSGNRCRPGLGQKL